MGTLYGVSAWFLEGVGGMLGSGSGQELMDRANYPRRERTISRRVDGRFGFVDGMVSSIDCQRNVAKTSQGV